MNDLGFHFIQKYLAFLKVTGCNGLNTKALDDPATA